jgi:hypothetical protein
MKDGEKDEERIDDEGHDVREGGERERHLAELLLASNVTGYTKEEKKRDLKFSQREEIFFSFFCFCHLSDRASV